MPLPPKNDPHRPIEVAVRWLWVTGIVFIAIALIVMANTLLRSHGTNSIVEGMAWTTIAILGPGIIYLISAIHLKRRLKWAFNLGSLLLACQLLFILGFVIASVIWLVILIVYGQLEISWMGFVLVAGLIVIALFLSLFMIILQRVASAATKMPDGPRGFEPIMPINTPNPESNTSPRSPE